MLLAKRRDPEARNLAAGLEATSLRKLDLVALNIAYAWMGDKGRITQKSFESLRLERGHHISDEVVAALEFQNDREALDVLSSSLDLAGDSAYYAAERMTGQKWEKPNSIYTVAYFYKDAQNWWAKHRETYNVRK